MSHYAQTMSHYICVMYTSHARLSCWGGQVNFLGRTSRNCLVWSTHTHIPASRSYIQPVWQVSDLPCTEGIMFILQVGVVYPCSLYHI